MGGSTALAFVSALGSVLKRFMISKRLMLSRTGWGEPGGGAMVSEGGTAGTMSAGV